MSDRLACIVCRGELENLMEGAGGIQPMHGLEFVSHGHYGSTVFDPMDGTSLRVCICDECLEKAGADGIVFAAGHAEPSPPPRPAISIWRPRDER